MKLNLLSIIRLLLVFSGLFGMPTAVDAGIMGGELTYTYVANSNNRYAVKLQVAYDCSSGPLPTTQVLEVRNGNCNGPLVYTITVPLLSSSIQIGSQYCASSAGGNSPCGAGLPPNYQLARYEWEVSLPPAVLWTLSVTAAGRTGQATIAGGSAMYWETTLSNQIGSTTIQNNSAQFDALNAAAAIVCWQQETSLNFSATDVDGDELVYSLEQPLSGCGSPIGYRSYTTNGLINVGTATAPCFAQVPATTASYSAAFPVASFTVAGPACPSLRTATPYFRFNAATGTYRFRPAIYDSQNLDQNRYVVVGKVSEYRRINGVRTLTGTTRREMQILVTDCGSNQIPATPIAVNSNLNSGAIIINTADSTFIRVSTCNATRVLIRFSDPNTNDLLTVTMPALDSSAPGVPSYLPTDVGTFRITRNGTRQPVGVLYMQPDVAFASQTYRIPIQIRDNGCPVTGTQTWVLVITVRNRNAGQITVSGAAGAAVCAGSAVALTARTLRPDSVIVSVPNPSTLLANYTYRWEPANGLAPADQNSRVITVNPTQTTRYIVHIAAMDFRLTPIPTCIDTTSVLVRVVAAPPQPSITETGNELFSSAPVGNQWYFNGQPLAGATATSLVPTVAGSYTVVASTVGTLPICSSPPSLPYAVVFSGMGNVQIAPNPTANGRFTVQLTGYQQPVMLTLFDMMGRSLTTVSVAAPNPVGTTQNLDLADAKAGVYMLRVLTQGHLEVQRVVRK